jgi:colanic acid/amylovoran biosynthesis protein
MKEYIVITGGLTNKGLQAMVFHVISELAPRYPNMKFAVLAQGYGRLKNKRHLYAFDILPWSFALQLAAARPFWRVAATAWWTMRRRRDRLAENGQITDILERAALAVDVSGFALSSQWPFMNSLKFILNLAVMKRYGIKTYLLPQSFGPFAYNPAAKLILFPLFRKYLPYPVRIHAREEAGLRDLARFTRDNLTKSPDLVLLGRSIDPGKIYRTKPERLAEHLKIPGGAVAIVPNSRVIRFGNKRVMLGIYRELVSRLLEEGRSVYVLWHSYVDRGIWEVLKRKIPPHPHLIFLDFDLDCMEIVELFSRFAMVIPARFHALVHAYKAGTPALAFGWSAKYRELMAALSQERYLFDTREKLQPQMVLAALRELCANRDREAGIIAERLARLQEEHDLLRDITP